MFMDNIPTDNKTQTTTVEQVKPDLQGKSTQTTETVSSVPASAKTIKPVHIDGGLYVIMGVTGALVESLGTDEAVKLISPTTLFYEKLIVGAALAGAMSLKMYRSTGYSDSKS